MKKYTQKELEILLREFLKLPAETEWLEFKENYHDPEGIGKYISGISNSACMERRQYGYMVFGVHDKTHELTGTTLDPDKPLSSNNCQPRIWLRNKLSPEIGFEFYPFFVDGKRIVLLEIEAAYRQPVAFEHKEYIRFGSSLTELSRYPVHEENIWRSLRHDWTGETIPGVGLDALSQEAIEFARKQFQEKHKEDSFAEEIREWDDWTFLNKSRLAIENELTRAAILLLGKPESSHYLAPAVAKITWNLVDSEGVSLDYHHFEPPFLITVDQLFAKIRNIVLRTMPDGTLFPIEITQYDSWVFREALHNCIVHQDYHLRRNIVVTEYPDRILFANAGKFLPETVENALFSNQRPRFYPNQHLAEVMVELKMIDTIGSGIARMFRTQQKRYMPMPEYDFSNQEVLMTLWGKILDLRYTRLLIREAELSLKEIVLLDKLQKNQQIQKEEAESLRKKKLIEGRFPNVFPASEIARKGDKIKEYLETRGFDDQFYMQRILEFLCLKGSAKREEIYKLLVDHLPTFMTEEQKQHKITNLLAVKMSYREELVQNTGGKGKSCWSLTEKGRQICRKNHPDCKRKCQ